MAAHEGMLVDTLSVGGHFHITVLNSNKRLWATSCNLLLPY